MNFKEKKIEIELILQKIFSEKQVLINKTNELFLFIDPEFYNKSYEDDILVTNQIKKRLLVITQLIEKNIRENFIDEENFVIFNTLKFNLEDYEPIIYLYAHSTDQKTKFKSLPKVINYNDELLISIDFIKGFSLLPWS